MHGMNDIYTLYFQPQVANKIRDENIYVRKQIAAQRLALRLKERRELRRESSSAGDEGGGEGAFPPPPPEAADIAVAAAAEMPSSSSNSSNTCEQSAAHSPVAAEPAAGGAGGDAGGAALAADVVADLTVDVGSEVVRIDAELRGDIEAVVSSFGDILAQVELSASGAAENLLWLKLCDGFLKQDYNEILPYAIIDGDCDAPPPFDRSASGVSAAGSGLGSAGCGAAHTAGRLRRRVDVLRCVAEMLSARAAPPVPELCITEVQFHFLSEHIEKVTPSALN
jgi:hypothetical protein